MGKYEEKEFQEQFQSVLSDDDMMYLYHITGKGIGKMICENGLLLIENRLSSTTLPIDKEILSNPVKFIKEEHGNNIRETEEMVIIGCPKDNVEELVCKNDHEYEGWNEDQNCDYIIHSNYILGYIDMNTLDFVYNEGYDFVNDSMML